MASGLLTCEQCDKVFAERLGTCPHCTGQTNYLGAVAVLGVIVLGGLILLVPVAWAAQSYGIFGFLISLFLVGGVLKAGLSVSTWVSRKGKATNSLETLKQALGYLPARTAGRDGNLFAHAEEEQAFLWATGTGLHKLKYSDILEVEIRTDSASVNSVNKASLAAGVVGGLVLLGGVGAVVGGLGAKRHERKQVSSVEVRIITASAGDIVLELYRGQPVEANSPAIRKAVEEAEYWRGECIRAMRSN